MMTFLAIVLGLALVGAIGVITALALGRVSDAKVFANERVEHANTRSELERVRFELTNTQQALVAANKRAQALEEVLQDEVESAANPALPPTDVRGRVLRIARKWSEAAAARSPLPASTAAEALPVDPATEPTEPAGVRFDANGLMQPD